MLFPCNGLCSPFRLHVATLRPLFSLEASFEGYWETCTFTCHVRVFLSVIRAPNFSFFLLFCTCRDQCADKCRCEGLTSL